MDISTQKCKFGHIGNKEPLARAMESRAKLPKVPLSEKRIGKTEITKKMTVSKKAAKAPRRATRASERVAREKKERAGEERNQRRHLKEVTQKAEKQKASKRKTWNSLQAAEKAMEALKEVFEEKEMIWARSCIKRGRLLYEEDLEGEVKEE